MDELTLNGKIYISSKKAAEITGYAKDYVGQLCREGRVEATLVGRSWYILESAIREHRFNKEKRGNLRYVEEKGVTETDAWSNPVYKSEELDAIPTLIVEKTKTSNQERYLNENNLSGMQSIWREWFDKKEVDLGETRYIEQSNTEVVYNYGNIEEAEISTNPDSYIKKDDNDEHFSEGSLKDEDIVPIHRSYAFYEDNRKYDTENNIVNPRRTRMIKENIKLDIKINTVVLRSIIIGIIILSISIAVIGTGISGDTYISYSDNLIIKYLGGTSIISK